MPFFSTRLDCSNDVGGVSDGNRLRLYTDGDEAFAAAYEAIGEAEKHVWLESYIVEPDEVGQLVIEALAEAARRGCDVILLFDRWGSPRLSNRHAEPIRKAGGRVALYNPLLPWRKLGRKLAPFIHRDHRKILIADDVGFCGGRNISTEYGGPGPERFYDVTLRMEGPCVRDLASVFLDSLVHATGQAPPLPPSTPPFEDGVPVEVLELNRRKNEHDLDRALLALLNDAQHSCLLTTPYFIPPAWFLDALVRALQRGVDVRVLTAGRSDVPLARIAGRHVYGHLLRPGGHIYEMQHPTLHAKTLVIDGCHSLIGSYNVDQFGSTHNLEVGVAVRDAGLAQQLEEAFGACLEHSKEITLAAWTQRPRPARLVEWLLFQLARL